MVGTESKAKTVSKLWTESNKWEGGTERGTIGTSGIVPFPFYFLHICRGQQAKWLTGHPTPAVAPVLMLTLVTTDPANKLGII